LKIPACDRWEDGNCRTLNCVDCSAAARVHQARGALAVEPLHAQPYGPQIQRYENGKRVDKWSDRVCDYAFCDAQGRRIPKKRGKGFLPNKGFRWSWREWTPPRNPHPVPGDSPIYDESKPPLCFAGKDSGMENRDKPVRCYLPLVRHWTGMYYKWLLPAEEWAENAKHETVLKHGVRDTSIMRSTVGKPAEPRDVSDWFAWLHVGPEIKVKGWKAPAPEKSGPWAGHFDPNENHFADEEERSPFLPMACAWYPPAGAGKKEPDARFLLRYYAPRLLTGAAGGKKEWIILSKHFIRDKLAYWPAKMTKRNCQRGKIMGMESGDWERDCKCGGTHLDRFGPLYEHCGFPPRFPVDISHETIILPAVPSLGLAREAKKTAEIVDLNPKIPYRERKRRELLSRRYYGEFRFKAPWMTLDGFRQEDRTAFCAPRAKHSDLIGERQTNTRVPKYIKADGQGDPRFPHLTDGVREILKPIVERLDYLYFHQRDFWMHWERGIKGPGIKYWAWGEAPGDSVTDFCSVEIRISREGELKWRFNKWAAGELRDREREINESIADDAEAQRILNLLIGGAKEGQISDGMGISISTVQRKRKKYYMDEYIELKRNQDVIFWLSLGESPKKIAFILLRGERWVYDKLKDLYATWLGTEEEEKNADAYSAEKGQQFRK
jgi:DNA-binding CsgD family transcriptional regulator